VLWHVLHPWLRPVKDLRKANLFYSGYTSLLFTNYSLTMHDLQYVNWRSRSDGNFEATLLIKCLKWTMKTCHLLVSSCNLLVDQRLDLGKTFSTKLFNHTQQLILRWLLTADLTNQLLRLSYILRGSHKHANYLLICNANYVLCHLLVSTIYRNY
jgi:hypothetical protein